MTEYKKTTCICGDCQVRLCKKVSCGVKVSAVCGVKVFVVCGVTETVVRWGDKNRIKPLLAF